MWESGTSKQVEGGTEQQGLGTRITEPVWKSQKSLTISLEKLTIGRKDIVPSPKNPIALGSSSTRIEWSCSHMKMKKGLR